MVIVPALLAPPRAALTLIASALLRVMLPVTLLVAPAMFSVPLVLVNAMSPAPVAVAVKLAPSVSVMYTPPEPVAAVMVPAVV